MTPPKDTSELVALVRKNAERMAYWEDSAIGNRFDCKRAADVMERAADELVNAYRIIGEMRPLFIYHKTGGHEGDGSDERISKIDAALSTIPLSE